MTENGENKRLHLKMIEDVISRMGSNSFLIKGWSITAIGGLIILYVAKIQHPWSYNLLWIALGICLMFWINDAYYLQKERQYRQLYESVRQKAEGDIDFCMRIPKTNENIFCCMCRPIFLFSYVPIFLVLLAILYINKP